MCALCASAEKAEIAHCNYIDSSTSNDTQYKQIKGSCGSTRKGLQGCGFCDVYVSYIHTHTYTCTNVRRHVRLKPNANAVATVTAQLT